MAGYTEKQLTEALETIWELALKHVPEAEMAALTEKSSIFDEINMCGAGGPVGSGLGRFGGHAISDDGPYEDDEDKENAH